MKLRMPCSDMLRRVEDGLDYGHVAGAAADVPLDGGLHLVLRRPRVVPEKGVAGDEHPRGAPRTPIRPARPGRLAGVGFLAPGCGSAWPRASPRPERPSCLSPPGDPPRRPRRFARTTGAAPCPCASVCGRPPPRRSLQSVVLVSLLGIPSGLLWTTSGKKSFTKRNLKKHQLW